MIKIIKMVVWVLVYFPEPFFAQKYDFNWLMGYAGMKGDTNYGITHIDFNNGNPLISYNPDISMYMFEASTSISDSLGNLKYYSNGYDIENRNFKKISRATDLCNKYDLFALKINQGILMLPLFKMSKHIYFYLNELKLSANSKTYFRQVDLRYLILQDSFNSEFPAVLYRDSVIIKDSLNNGMLTACKHANGRDWWLLTSATNSNKMYKVLVNDVGDSKLFTQFIKDTIFYGLGQAQFSPNGEFYAISVGVKVDSPSMINLYRFDRCSGELSFVFNYKLKFGTIANGLCFSPNSRFLYFTNGIEEFQLDLFDSISSFSIIRIDSIDKQPPPFGTNFDMHQIGPDARIYIASGTANKSMHIINSPNLKGSDCQLLRNGINLRTYNINSIPNMLNFRLGPVDGSICDSLGIDNIPWAHWRYDQDTLDYLKFQFTDLSAYEVEEWYWDFGDLNSPVGTSRDTNPIHTFSQNGVYDVCLIVKNKNGADTLCRTITIGTVSTKDNDKKILDIQVWPNSCKDFLIINVLDYNPQKMVLQIYNSIGELVLSKKLYQGSNSIDVEDLHSGIYFISILENGKEIKSEKLIKS